MNRRFLEGMRGLTVIGSGGRLLGELVDLEIDDTTLQVVGLILKVESAAVEGLGLTKPFWSRAYVMIPAGYVGAVTDVILLKASLDQIGEQIKAASASDESGS